MTSYHMQRARMLLYLAGSHVPIDIGNVKNVRIETEKTPEPIFCIREIMEPVRTVLKMQAVGKSIVMKSSAVGQSDWRSIELRMLALALTSPDRQPSMYELRVLDTVMNEPSMAGATVKKEKSWLIGAKQGKGVKAQQRAATKKRNKRRRK